MEDGVWLFSYGTLRQPEVQRAVFGRELDSDPDVLIGFELSEVAITDPSVIAASGCDRHPILRRSNDDRRVPGSALRLKLSDLASADHYEVGDYERISVTLASGRSAYVYVQRDQAAQ